MLHRTPQRLFDQSLLTSKRYYLMHTVAYSNHLIYKHVRYCNIYSIIWLADFQFKFYIRGGGGGGGEGGHSLLFC